MQETPVNYTRVNFLESSTGCRSGNIIPPPAAAIQPPGKQGEKQNASGHDKRNQVRAQVGQGAQIALQYYPVFHIPLPAIPALHQNGNEAPHMRQFGTNIQSLIFLD